MVKVASREKKKKSNIKITFKENTTGISFIAEIKNIGNNLKTLIKINKRMQTFWASSTFLSSISLNFALIGVSLFWRSSVHNSNTSRSNENLTSCREQKFKEQM